MRKTQRGFTLIELLTVVAIIIILISFMFSAFAIARDQSRSLRCRNSLRQMQFANLLYSREWTDFAPLFFYTSDATKDVLWTANQPLLSAISDNVITTSSQAAFPKRMACPASKPVGATPLSLSYGYNPQRANWQWVMGTFTGPLRKWPGYADRITFGDSVDTTFVHNGWNGGGSPPLGTGYWINGVPGQGLTWSEGVYRMFTPMFRHRQSMNVAWGDGRVSTSMYNGINQLSYWNYN